MIKTLLLRVAIVAVIMWAASDAVIVNSADHDGSGNPFTCRFAGVYEYVYKYNSKNLIENHYIVLESVNDILMGRYYGTSDDFDDAREGYLPGFFVAPMGQLLIQGEKITFEIELQADDLYVRPIDLSIKSSREVNRKDNKRWISDYQPGIRLTRNSVIYIGEIINDEFHIKTEYGLRIFKKIK